MPSNVGVEKTVTYISLEALSSNLGLPKGYLRDLAVKGQIPCLNVNGRLRFSRQDVREALEAMARKEGRGD